MTIDKVARLAPCVWTAIAPIGRVRTFLFGAKEMMSINYSAANARVAREAMKASKVILNLKDNWDGEGAKPILRGLWVYAISIAELVCGSVGVISDSELPIPNVGACADGSIDLFWDHEQFQLLLNVISPFIPITFQGTSKKGEDQIRGKIQRVECEYVAANFITARMAEYSRDCEEAKG